MTLLDNIGLLVAGLFRQPSSASKTVSGIKQISGATFSTSVYQTETNSTLFNITALKQAQVGKGTSTPTRQDFDIENVFPDSPEAVKNNSLGNGYNSGLGKITMATLISTTGGAGSITEVCKFVSWRDNIGGSTDRTVCLMRDVISPVAFIIGESINIDHEVLI